MSVPAAGSPRPLAATRRRFLARGGAAAAGLALARWSRPTCRARAAAVSTELVPLQVAYAGSMTSLVEGPLKRAAAEELGLELRGTAQGSSALAQLIAGGSLRPDVFVPVTLTPLRTVQQAGKVARAVPVARTEMVIAYSPRSRFRDDFARVGQAGSPDWWELLSRPGLRFGRTDPVADPQGRNIIFVLQLAARRYGQPDLAKRVLGDERNPAQIFAEPAVQAQLQAGQLDAASAYKIQPKPFGIPYLTLPPEINLGRGQLQAEYVAGASLTLDGKTYHPESLVYTAAVLHDAPRPAEAEKFVSWLQGPTAQALFREFDYDAPEGAAVAPGPGTAAA